MNVVLFSGNEIEEVEVEKEDDLISTIDLRDKINEFRKAVGENPIRNNDFINRVEDELEGELPTTKFSQSSKGGEPARYYELTREQTLLVGMRESKVVRRNVLEWIKNLEEEINNNAIVLPDFNNPVVAARAWANEVEEKLLVIEESNLKSELISELDKKIENDAPLVEYAQNVAMTENAQDFLIVAKNFGVGRNTLFEMCRDAGILMSSTQFKNVPYQRYVDAEYFTVDQSVFYRNGVHYTSYKTMITGKGQRYLYKTLFQK